MSGIKSRIISDDLVKRIVEGDLKGKTRLPAEYDLAEFYQCSRPTLRKAVAGLQEAGYITSVKGSGSYINERHEAAQKAAPCMLGSIFPNMGPGYFFDRLCGSLAQCAAEGGFSLVWGGYISPRSEKFEQQVMQICERYVEQRISALFFSPFEYHPGCAAINRRIVDSFSAAAIPIVLIDSNIKPFPQESDFDMVSMDHIHAAYIIAGHILERGSRRLAFFAPPHSNNTIKMRLIGWHEALLDSGITPDAGMYFEADAADSAAVAHFIEEKKPDGILCSNDVTAINVMRTLEKLGVRIPDEIKLGGFDNLSGSVPCSRAITSIMQPVREISETALELITGRMKSPRSGCMRITIPGALVIGETT